MSCDYHEGRRDEAWSWLGAFLYVGLIMLAYHVGRAVEQIEHEKQQTQTVSEKKTDLPAPPMAVRVK